MKHVRLYIFLYFTAGWMLDVVYRCMDYVTRNQPPHWAERSVEQATGYYLAMALLPWIFFVTRRFPSRCTSNRSPRIWARWFATLWRTLR